MDGKWIWIDKKGGENAYGEFFVPFTYTDGNVILELSADSEYAIFVNGVLVGAGQYADFPWYKVCDCHDITRFLRKGDNQIKLLVWHCGDENFCHYVNRAGVRFSLSIDGETLVCSSKKTLCRPCTDFLQGDTVPKITRQLGYSFVWAGGSAEALRPAVEIEGMPEKLYAREIDNVEILPFKEAALLSNGAYDLGEETVGYPYIEILAKKGERVRVCFGEWLNDDGRVTRLMHGYDFSFEIIGTGEKTTVLNPVRRLGCRYLEVQGDCKIFTIGLLPVRYPFTKNTLVANTALRQKICDVSVRTLELNALEHYMDCPWREQAFWVFDSRFQMRYGYLAFQGGAYQRAGLKLLSEDRRDDGLVSMIVPTSSKDAPIPSFSISYIYAMAEYAEETGDFSLVDEYFEKMQTMLCVFTEKRENGLIPCLNGYWNFYEWNETLAGDSGNRLDSILNLLVLYALQKFEYIRKLLPTERKTVNFTPIAKELEQAVLREFYDEKEGLIRTFQDESSYAELPNALAVLCGIVKGEKARLICDKIVAGGMLKTTLSMSALKYDALLQTDKKAYGAWILRDIDDNFSYMLSQGATSFWETIKGEKDFDGAGSLCHGWSALPIYYYHKLGVLRLKR